MQKLQQTIYDVFEPAKVVDGDGAVEKRVNMQLCLTEIAMHELLVSWMRCADMKK